MQNDELLDIVSLNDEVIGQKYRSEVYELAMKNFRAINAFLINEQRQLWIPTRTAHKKLFPLSLDTSVGGHVSAGENYEQAFVRELHEELNIHIHEVSYQYIAKLTPHEHNVSAFMHLYMIETNQSPNYNPDDFISAQWYNVDEVLNLIAQGTPSKNDLPVILHYLKKINLL